MKVPAITQEYVQIRDFPGAAAAGYDALWDLLPGPDGRIYCGVSSEGQTSLSARLYAYDPLKDQMSLCFNVQDVTHPPETTIPQSKIHTSMAVMEDNRLIMCTHTTAPAPTHPVWAPWQCYHDQYEGYPGSHVIIYDPRTNDARDMGIPVPRESNYGGGCYVSEVRQYFMLGLMRRHLYVFDLNADRTYDRGFVGVGFRLFRDKKGLVYGIAPTGKMNRGRMWRYDPFRASLEDLDLEVPGRDGVGVLSFVEQGPDGRFYFARLWSDHLMVFDPENNAIKDLGIGFPDADQYSFGQPLRDPIRTVAGMRFLPDGKLYYGMVSGSLSELVALMRRDILHGGDPEFLGFVYGDEQATVMISEMVVGPDKKLYLGDTCNYGKPPRLVIVDAMRLSPPDEAALKIHRRWHDEKRWRREKTAGDITQRSASSFIDRKQCRLELYDALLPADDCAVRDMCVDTHGNIHIAAAGGQMLVWDGKRTNIVHRHHDSLQGMDIAGDWVYFADQHRIWRYKCSGSMSQPELYRELPDEYHIAMLKTGGDWIYGLLEPGFRPFVVDQNLWLGPITGNLARGPRTIILGSDGCLYGARDEAFLFAVKPGENQIADLQLRLPGMKDRYFMARWTAAVIMDNIIYGGTSDGYLFQFDYVDKKTYNLGKPALSLGIVDLTVVDGRVFGIAGRGTGDLCRLFCYSRETGFTDLGLSEQNGLSCLTALPDGRVAVGGAERIAHVDIYQF